MTWRDKAAPLIAEIIARVGTSDMKALRRALREAYPFGPKQYHPYRIWYNEIKRQLCVIENGSTVNREIQYDPNQMNLFERDT